LSTTRHYTQALDALFPERKQRPVWAAEAETTFLVVHVNDSLLDHEEPCVRSSCESCFDMLRLVVLARCRKSYKREFALAVDVSSSQSEPPVLPGRDMAGFHHRQCLISFSDRTNPSSHGTIIGQE
jgi:hypothetical protein